MSGGEPGFFFDPGKNGFHFVKIPDHKGKPDVQTMTPEVAVCYLRKRSDLLRHGFGFFQGSRHSAQSGHKTQAAGIYAGPQVTQYARLPEGLKTRKHFFLRETKPLPQSGKRPRREGQLFLKQIKKPLICGGKIHP
jgi:hypothetical protein